DILGEVFEETRLKDLLIQAIRYGDQPEVRARLTKKIDQALDRDHLRSLASRVPIRACAASCASYAAHRRPRRVPSSRPRRAKKRRSTTAPATWCVIRRRANTGARACSC